MKSTIHDGRGLMKSEKKSASLHTKQEQVSGNFNYFNRFLLMHGCVVLAERFLQYLTVNVMLIELRVFPQYMWDEGFCYIPRRA